MRKIPAETEQQHTQVMIRHDCDRHARYLLACDQWDTLTTAGTKCAACGCADADLVVDHDHSLGRWAVRGLVCRPCNNALRTIDRGRTPAPPRMAAYLANPWHAAHVTPRPAVAHPPSTFDPNEDPAPALVGAYEVAQILGVSRQRVSQLMEAEGFPEPAATLGMGSVWLERDVEEWAEERDRRLGRI
jgi:predicted DNA-binding transcriptional regulator AlpA